MDTDLFIYSLLLASSAGLFPALLWLQLWIREDKTNPEPKKRIIYAFLLGMVAVPFAYISQKGIAALFLQGLSIDFAVNNVFVLGVLVIALWSFIEELLKYFASYYGGIKWKSNDEPIDVVIYLVVASLGFAALENILYLIEPLFIHGDINMAFLTSNFRFVGASLVHVASSGIIGIFVAFSYFKEQKIKKRYLTAGFILAVSLHATFNLFIMKGENNSNTLPAFFGIWIIIIIVIIILERIKNIHLNKINS